MLKAPFSFALGLSNAPFGEEGIGSTWNGRLLRPLGCLDWGRAPKGSILKAPGIFGPMASKRGQS